MMASPFEHLKKGALHSWMGVKESEHIPRGELREVQRRGVGGTYEGQKITTHRMRQVNFALNFGKRR